MPISDYSQSNKLLIAIYFNEFNYQTSFDKRCSLNVWFEPIIG